MRGDAMADGFGLPPVRTWIRNLVIGLFGLYVVELIAATALGDGIYDLLPLYGFGEGFAPWQLVTRYLLQGRNVFNVMFGLIAVYIALPLIDRTFSARQLSQALAAMFVGGSVLALSMGALGLVSGAATGWDMFLPGAFALIGLASPTLEFRLFFVLPVRAIWFTWGAGIIAGLVLLADHSLGAADYLGAWGGAIGWWYLIGPGARRRTLIAKSKKIEKELTRFQVIPGGRNRDDDDVVH